MEKHSRAVKKSRRSRGVEAPPQHWGKSVSPLAIVAAPLLSSSTSTGTCASLFHHDDFQLSISWATGRTQLLPSPTSSLTRHHIRAPKASRPQKRLWPPRHFVQPPILLSPATNAKGPSPPSPIYYSNASNNDLSCYARHGKAVSPVPRYDQKP